MKTGTQAEMDSLAAEFAALEASRGELMDHILSIYDGLMRNLRLSEQLEADAAVKLALAALTVLPVVFYGARDLFKKLPVPPHVKPAIGGLGVGLLAIALPQVLGGGYGWIQLAINGKLAASLLLALVAGKIIQRFALHIPFQ